MYQEKEVSVGELNEMYHSGKYEIEIDSPDGYQPIGQWFNKGVMPLVKITTKDFSTVCAERHLVQTNEDKWLLASELSVGDEILTTNGIQAVIDIANIDSAECYDFEILHPNHRYWGDGVSSHNSGKSYICSGNIVRHAQEQGIFPILIDTENALDESWLQALGVDTSEDKLLKLNMSMIDDVAKTISEFMKDYKARAPEDRHKVLFVVDSLGMLLTPTDVNQFEAGDMKGDMGRKPKALTALVRNTINMFGNYNVGMVATNHTYASQDMFDPDDKISGGQGFIYASSIVVAIRKLKLKEDEDGNKTSSVNGIRAACKIMKTRYAKPFETIQIEIPYTTGMSPYSGLFELFEGKGWLTKDGNRYVYKFASGESIKLFRKEYRRNEGQCLDLIMDDIMKNNPDQRATADSSNNVDDITE
jgi:recombination protein RecA